MPIGGDDHIALAGQHLQLIVVQGVGWTGLFKKAEPRTRVQHSNRRRQRMEKCAGVGKAVGQHPESGSAGRTRERRRRRQRCGDADGRPGIEEGDRHGGQRPTAARRDWVSEWVVAITAVGS
jgi:hypothetical protein